MNTEQLRTVDRVKTQNLSVQEVEDMRRDHEFLSKQLEDLEVKAKDGYRTVMSLEVLFTNRSAEAEDSVDTYMNYISNLRLYPRPPPPWENVELALELRSGTQRAEDMLSGPNIDSVIKPTLTSVAEVKRRERAEKEDERIRLEHDLDKLTGECENLEDELGMMEKQIATINEQADTLREVSFH